MKGKREILFRLFSVEKLVRDVLIQQREVLRRLACIEERQGEMMAQLTQELKDLAAKFDEATNEIATDLASLRDKIKNSMTDAEVAEVKQAFQEKIARLEALGQDPADPVPPTP